MNVKKKNLGRAAAIITAVLIISCCTALIAVAVNLHQYKLIQCENQICETALIGKDERVNQIPFLISASAGSAKKDQPVKIMAEKSGWMRIMFNDGGKLHTGFIKSDSVYNRLSDSVKAQSIEIDTNEITAKAGESISVDAKLFPVTSTEKISWSSSDENIAKVEDGKITVLAAGSAVITAKTENCSQSINLVSIENDPEFEFTKHSFTVDLNGTIDLKKSLKTKCGGVEWKSSDSNIVSVDNGVIKAAGKGAAVITAKISGASASCRIYIKNANTNASSPLILNNAYGDIFNYHPSVLYFEKGFGGYKYWCAYTPYKGNDDYWENPHIEVSNNLKEWSAPKGFKNPLEPVPDNYEHGQVYNSDTELVYNSKTKLLECWWRFYDRPNKRTVLKRKTTKDGVHWSNSEEMLTGEIGKYDFLSPSIIYEDGVYKMWAINQNTDYSLDYRESSDGKHWGSLRHIKITYSDKKLANWHLDVIHTAKGYEALISAYYPEENDRSHMNLYYTCSQDNINYPTAEKLFSPSSSSKAFDNRGLYRSSLLYANGKYYMFYSALNKKTGPSGIGLISGGDVYSMS